MKHATIVSSARGRALAGILVFAASACSATPSPSAIAKHPTAKAPPIVAAPNPPGPTTLIDTRPPPVAAASPPVPSLESLAVATRRFEPIALPAVGAILGIDGRDAKDVWMLGEGGAILRWDGARAERRKTPSCPVHIEVSDGQGHTQPYVDEPGYQRLSVTPREIILGGLRHDLGFQTDFAAFVEARSRDGSAWSCVKVEGYGTPVHRTTAGSALDIVLLDDSDFTIDGRHAPVPVGLVHEEWLLGARANDDVWLGARRIVALWHWNGVTWYPRPSGLASLIDLWVDEVGSAWVLGSTSEHELEGNTVLHWDVVAKAWRALPLPPGLRAKVLGGTSAHDVWIFGERAWYQWNGEQLRRAEAPLGAVKAAWTSASGELFVGGADRTRQVGTKNNKAPAGAVVRALALATERP